MMFRLGTHEINTQVAPLAQHLGFRYGGNLIFAIDMEYDEMIYVFRLSFVNRYGARTTYTKQFCTFKEASEMTMSSSDWEVAFTKLVEEALENEKGKPEASPIHTGTI